MHPDSTSLSAEDIAPVPPRPGFGFLFAHPANFIALGMGSGLTRLAPGTSGTLWAWATFVIWERFVPPARFDAWTALALLLALPLGWWACTVAARNLRIADPGSIVWDEIVAFWAVLWLISPAGFWGQLAAFGLFRYFDAAKPGPVAWADSLFKGFGARGGFGILFDDLVAAGCTLMVIALWRFFW